MSLSQRLQRKSDGVSDVEHYETLIRQLKLLSKSQTALLKAYIHEKLTEATKLVNKAASIADSNGNRDLRNAIKALKLDELEVDVGSTKLALQEELSKLRTAIDNGGVLPVPQASTTATAQATTPPPAPATNTITQTVVKSDPKDAQKIKDLEAENNKLNQQIADLKRDLSNATASSSASTAKLSQQASASSEEVNKLRKENETLNAKVKDLTSQLDAKTKEMKKMDEEIKELNEAIADDSAERRLQAEVEQLKASLNQEKQFKVTLQKDLETKMNTKVAEAKAAAEKLVKDKEAEWAAEREEMEVALAQELEDVERAKDEERKVVEEENKELQKKVKSLQAVNNGLSSSLRRIADKMKSLQKDYKTHSSQSKREITDAIGNLKQQYGATIANKIKALGEELKTINTKYLREMSERKRLHNLVQELKGNIRVYMRCRPPTTKELEQFGNDAMCVSFPGNGEVKVFNNEKNREKVWEFDEVFDPSTTQEQVYSDVSALVTSVLDGYNVCIFAYGQTGSGKTWTMSGPPSDRGVNTRALEELFVKARERSGDWVDNISVSILEVYNEEIHDLLAERHSDEKLEVKMGEYGNYVPGLTHIPVNSIEAVLNLMALADRNRSQSTTNMNEHSSRSHMMLTVTVISEFIPNKTIQRGKLNLVDLAGSERINKSGAQGQALKEAQNINKSLSALGDVIAARAQKNAHIPFRNSTLTFLLQDSLSQDSKTLMIVCVSPVLYNCEETYCSLNFAARVRTVELGKATKHITPGPGGSTKAAGATPSGSSAASAGTRKISTGR